MIGLETISHIPANKCRRCRYYNQNSRWHHCKQGTTGPEEPSCRYELIDLRDFGDEV
jgi:hypothetical protein